MVLIDENKSVKEKIEILEELELNVSLLYFDYEDLDQILFKFIQIIGTR
jgi:hypothetical protein